MQADSEKVVLHISCKKLKDMDTNGKSDPMVKLYEKAGGAWKLLDKTEAMKDNRNPNFFKTFSLNFKFEEQQALKFEVVDVDGETETQTIGVVETTLGVIMGARKNKLKADLEALNQFSGVLIVKGEKTDGTTGKVTMQWDGKKLMNTDGFFGKSDPFLRFFRIKKNGELLKVYETEVVKNDLNPKWEAFSISSFKLGACHSKIFKIECWDKEKDGNHQFIGECQVNIDMLNAGTRELVLQNPKKKSAGSLKLKEFAIEKCSKEVFQYMEQSMPNR